MYVVLCSKKEKNRIVIVCMYKMYCYLYFSSYNTSKRKPVSASIPTIVHMNINISTSRDVNEAHTTFYGTNTWNI